MKLYDKDGNLLTHEEVIKEMSSVIIPMNDCTRVEVIDSRGRAYTNYDVSNVQIAVQDDARTLKIFLIDEI